MFRYGPAILIVWTALLSAAPAKAQWFSNFWDGVHRDYKRNQYWPEPFLQADRNSVKMPFAVMTANGWRRQNLLSDYHFNEETQQLNQAGEMKLRFILTQMPPSRRTVFVQRGLNEDVTAMRLDRAQRAAAQMQQGSPADIVESDLPNDGWPADDIDAVTRQFQATRPAPRLRNATNSSSSAGSGSSGAGAGGGSGSGN